MGRIEVLDENEAKAAMGRDIPEELFEGFETTCGGTQPDHAEVGRVDWCGSGN